MRPFTVQLLRRFGAQARYYPLDERQQAFQRVEMCGLSGHHMLDTPRKAPLRHIRLHMQLHDKGSLYW